MGNKVSKPARKFPGTMVKTSNLGKISAQRIQLPSKDLKDKFDQSASNSAFESEAAKKDAGNIEKDDESSQHTSSWKKNVNQTSFDTTPEGKDGTDPQVDENFIKFINTLGRQIHSHTDSNPGHQSDVRALKQLLNRKRLYEKGQDEVKAQLETSDKTRSMIHPRTLTAIIYALNDVRVTTRDIANDYQVQENFLNNLSRFKVADNVVVIEETTKADEIGPKSGQPVARAASDPSLMDENGTVSVTLNQERLRKLRSRLE